MDGHVRARSIPHGQVMMIPHDEITRHYRRSGQKVLEVDGKVVYKAASAVDAGEVVAFEVCMIVCVRACVWDFI